MTDLIQNVQEVCKKWELKSTPNLARARRGTSHRQYTDRSTFHSTCVKNIRFKPRNCHASRIPYFNIPKYDGLAEFKMAPSIVAQSKQRPFLGVPCSKCLPQSKAFIQDSSVYLLSVYNVLHIPYFQRSFFQPINFIHALKFMKINQKPQYQVMNENVLKSERVLHAIQKASKEIKEECNNVSVENLEMELLQRADKILRYIKSSLSMICIRLTGLFLHIFLSKIFNRILVHKGHIEILKEVSQENIPIVYLPLHRSFFDYIAISYVLHMHSMQIPFVAVENCYNIPFLNFLLKFLGVFFIPKSPTNKQDEDYLYSAVFHSYMVECLKSGHSLQFFIEDGCSWSGKPQMHDSSLLSKVVNSVLEGSIDDVYIAPVSISYENILQENVANELLGLQKERNILSTLYSFWKAIHLHVGNARLNFCQPFSLKEFCNSSNPNLFNCFNGAILPDSPSSSKDVSFMFSEDSLSTANALAKHVIYDAVLSTSFMSTHLLGFLFITQYREGATQQQLENSMNWLREELFNRKCDIGFTGESSPAIKHAVDLLGKDLITSETVELEWTSSDLENNNVKVIVYKPVLKLPHVLELQYFANSLIPIFLLDSVLVNALYTLVDEICHFRNCDSRLYVYRDKLISKAVELNDILQFEFIACQPCADIALCFDDVLDKLIEKECLHIVGIGNLTGNKSMHSAKSRLFSFDPDDDDDDDDTRIPLSFQEQQLKVDLKEETINYLEYLRSILSPYIESYWLAACSLLHLVDDIKEESLFIEEIQMTARDKLYKGLLQYEESFSVVTLKNALRQSAS